MRVIGVHRMMLCAESSAALDDLVDAHQARLLAELDMFNDESAPTVATVQDCSGSCVVSTRPAWAPSDPHGALDMQFTVQHFVGKPGESYKAEVCMTLSDDIEEK